jgi:CHAT domain-containing protein
VFLAACRGGAGRPTADGTVGLSRAFLSAGASTVVAARWNVPDQATHYLVQQFYEEYLGGQDVAKSLQRAMLSTRSAVAGQYGVDANEVHPAEWGAFFVLGVGNRH